MLTAWLLVGSGMTTLLVAANNKPEVHSCQQVSEESMDARLTWSRITAEDAPTLTVDLSVGLGEIEVRS